MTVYVLGRVAFDLWPDPVWRGSETIFFIPRRHKKVNGTKGEKSCTCNTTKQYVFTDWTWPHARARLFSVHKGNHDLNPI